MRPLIGISCSIKCIEKSANFTHLPQQFHFLGEAYTNAVERAGGIPVILPSFEAPELMREAVKRLDGVILSGGADIDPAMFGERIISGVGPIDVRRDKAEAVLADEKKNTERAVPIVERDSRLGWDPRMEYVCDPARLKWKLQLLDYVSTAELDKFRLTNRFADRYEKG